MPKTMDELLSGSKTVEPLENEQIISAKVIEIKGKKLSLDLGPYGLGLVPKRELGLGKSFEVGQEVEAMVVDADAESGQVLMLSLIHI